MVPPPSDGITVHVDIAPLHAGPGGIGPEVLGATGFDSSSSLLVAAVCIVAGAIVVLATRRRGVRHERRASAVRSTP